MPRLKSDTKQKLTRSFNIKLETIENLEQLATREDRSMSSMIDVLISDKASELNINVDTPEEPAKPKTNRSYTIKQDNFTLLEKIARMEERTNSSIIDKLVEDRAQIIFDHPKNVHNMNNNEILLFMKAWFRKNRPDLSLDNEEYQNLIKIVNEDLQLAEAVAHPLIISEFLNNNFSFALYNLVVEIFSNEFPEEYESFSNLGILTGEVQSILMYLANSESNIEVSFKSYFDEDIKQKVKAAIIWNLHQG